MSQPFRGIFVIAQTPFSVDGARVLWDDFEREADWVVRAGAHGFVWPVMASEFTVLSTAERVKGMRRAVQSVGGRVPVIAGVADSSQAGAVALAEAAADAGADAVIAMPPWATKMNDRALFEGYYRAIADASGLPVVVQNVGAPLGSSLPGAFVVDLCCQIPLVQYLKEEKIPQGHSVSEVLALAGPEVKGVFSGAHGYWLMSEYRRGVAGNMPGAHLADVLAQVWDLLEAGDEATARSLHNALTILESIVRGMPAEQVHKEILVRRGVFTHAVCRNTALVPLDDVDRTELAYGLSQVEPFFRL